MYGDLHREAVPWNGDRGAGRLSRVGGAEVLGHGMTVPDTDGPHDSTGLLSCLILGEVS